MLGEDERPDLQDVLVAAGSADHDAVVAPALTTRFGISITATS
ncbi:MAG: hypothetical protein ACM3S3_11485 [Candidatus Doudnabacteria bacterium]